MKSIPKILAEIIRVGLTPGLTQAAIAALIEHNARMVSVRGKAAGTSGRKRTLRDHVERVAKPGMTCGELAAVAGCSVSTAAKVLREMRAK